MNNNFRLVMVTMNFRGQIFSRLAWGRVEGKKTRIDSKVHERLIAEAGAQGKLVRFG